MSGINKNIEFLSVFYDYKVFLDQLMPKEKQEEIDRKKKYRKELQERQREEESRREANKQS